MADASSSDDVPGIRDAFDGGPAHERVVFGIDERLFEIDLSAEHADQLRTVLAPYVEAGRYLAAMSLHPGRVDSQSARIRDWGRRHGWKVSDKGRLPADLVRAYEMSRD